MLNDSWSSTSGTGLIFYAHNVDMQCWWLYKSFNVYQQRKGTCNENRHYIMCILLKSICINGCEHTVKSQLLLRIMMSYSIDLNYRDISTPGQFKDIWQLRHWNSGLKAWCPFSLSGYNKPIWVNVNSSGQLLIQDWSSHLGSTPPSPRVSAFTPPTWWNWCGIFAYSLANSHLEVLWA